MNSSPSFWSLCCSRFIGLIISSEFSNIWHFEYRYVSFQRNNRWDAVRHVTRNGCRYSPRPINRLLSSIQFICGPSNIIQNIKRFFVIICTCEYLNGYEVKNTSVTINRDKNRKIFYFRFENKKVSFLKPDMSREW